MKKEIWRSSLTKMAGYIGRKIIYDDGTSHTSYEHREVMERYLGRSLSSCEVIHHKDGNGENNVLENLEILTVSGHAKRHARKAAPVGLRCALCGNAFMRTARYERHNRKQGKAGPFCSKVCAGRWSRNEQIKSGRVNLYVGVA